MKQLWHFFFCIGVVVSLSACSAQQAAPIANLSGFYRTQPVKPQDSQTQKDHSNHEVPQLEMKPHWKYVSAQVPQKKPVSVEVKKTIKASGLSKHNMIKKPKKSQKSKKSSHHKVQKSFKKQDVHIKKNPKLLAKHTADMLKFPVKGTVQGPTKTALKILAKKGEKVKAAASGEVLYTGPSVEGSGKMVIVKHKSEVLSAYSHLGQVSVKEGQQIMKGKILGHISTRRGHQIMTFQVRKNGLPIDPMTWLGLK